MALLWKPPFGTFIFKSVVERHSHAAITMQQHGDISLFLSHLLSVYKWGGVLSNSVYVALPIGGENRVIESLIQPIHSKTY